MTDPSKRREWMRQMQDPTALALALRLVVELTTELPSEGMPDDIARDINALHGAIRDVEIGLRLDDWVSIHAPGEPR